jgi:uncharacterized DUF497 family protein
MRWAAEVHSVPMKFEWDPAKDQGNQSKHGLGFEEAATVFGDRSALSWEDSVHSVGVSVALGRGVPDAHPRLH